MPPDSTTRIYVFPAIFLKRIQCPVCHEYTTALRVVQQKFKVDGLIFSHPSKHLLPCEHKISQEEEDAIVSELTKWGV